MKKILLIIIGIFLIGNVVALTQMQNVTVTVLPDKIAYIIKNPEKPDGGFLQAFNEINLRVDLIDDNNIRNTNFSNYRAVFIGDQALKNIKYIPEIPTILANKHYAKQFGFINKGTIVQLASNSILRIREDSTKTKVYEKPSFKLGGPNLFYYYLPYKNTANVTTIATTTGGSQNQRGSVIAYLSEENNKCFFGIIKTQFWTIDSKELFKDCVNFVIAP
ncbi:MAG: hypothetical protein WC584_02020 [Candidatus Pacearchaeota archaeon]